MLLVLWAYRTTSKKIMWNTPFRLVYGKEAIIPMEFLVPSLDVTFFTKMMDKGAFKNRLNELMQLEEDGFLAGFH